MSRRRITRGAPPRMIAKLSPLEADNVLLRKRLFRDIDRACRRPLSWIVGPAGSGKTTLAVSYLHARRLPTLWYRIDGGDADLASFVYHLGLAAQRLVPVRSVTFPLLTPEYQGGLGVFGRRRFETLSEALPRGTKAKAVPKPNSLLLTRASELWE